MHSPFHKKVAESPARVIALHCSGASGSQWAHFAVAAGDNYEVLTPEHYGSEITGPWTGEHAFTIADALRTACVGLSNAATNPSHAAWPCASRISPIASIAQYRPTNRLVSSRVM